MAFDDVYHVTYAGIADFHIVPVKQLVEDVCFREMLHRTESSDGSDFELAPGSREAFD